MKKTEPDKEDELRDEYDLKTLAVRGIGPSRPGFAGLVRLAPDVAEIYPSADSVNEALRFLARITRESHTAIPRTK